MKFVEQEQIAMMKQRIYTEQSGKCATCGKMLGQVFDLAHKIPQTKVNLKKYGHEIIHHRLNLAGTCRSANCNDAQMINPATRPVLAAEHVQMIRDAIETGE